MVTDWVTSADGTRIAFDRLGEESASGPAVVVVGGILTDRARTRPLAERLARRFLVVNYDRRGRGESGDTPPYAVGREVEDLAALIDRIGRPAAVYGHSSGAGLALEAAAAGLPISRLVLHEPPYGSDDEATRRSARDQAAAIRAAVAEGRTAEAIRIFLADFGLPTEVVEQTAADPRLLALARTMPYDHEVMGDETGGVIPGDRARSVTVPTRVLLGAASADFFGQTATRLVDLLPHGELVVVDGLDHDGDPEAVAPAVEAFLAPA